MSLFEGGCLCGQVRWRADAQPVNVRLCHCRQCQRATGGPYFARAVFLAEHFEQAGETTTWPSSPRVDRLACRRCGTPMFAQPKDPPARVGVSLSTLDDPSRLSPREHVWVSEKLPWVCLDDGLPQFERGA